MDANSGKKIPLTDVAAVFIYLIIVYAIAVLYFLTPDRAVSERENRNLQQFPPLSLSDIFSGETMTRASLYYTDQFPMRDVFVELRLRAMNLLGNGENKGAFAGKDGYIFQRFDIYGGSDRTYEETVDLLIGNLDSIGRFAADLSGDTGIPVYISVPPRKTDVMTNKLPDFFPAYRNGEFTAIIEEKSGEYYIPLLEALNSRKDEYIYYRTDHHWTPLGAYYAYNELGGVMGYDPMALSEFDVSVLSGEFYGVLWSRAGTADSPADEIRAFVTEGEDGEYTVAMPNGEVNQGFYFDRYLDTKDKYAVFIGGIKALTEIRSVKENGRPKLLLVSDSFGQPLVPFLARHYDIDIIDVRFFRNSIYAYACENEIDAVLILQNVESLMTQESIGIRLTRR